jgi:hypothetical protein
VAAVSIATGIEIRPNVRVPLQTLCGAFSLPPGVGGRVAVLALEEFLGMKSFSLMKVDKL